MEYCIPSMRNDSVGKPFMPIPITFPPLPFVSAPERNPDSP
jgi:hypothetical protein